MAVAAAAGVVRTRVTAMMKGGAKAVAAAGAGATPDLSGADSISSAPPQSPFARSGGSPDSIVTITTTMNNVHVCVADIDGQVISKVSGGNLGYKHRQRASPTAAMEIGTKAAEKAYAAGFRLCHLRLKGPSSGRAGALRGVQAGGVVIADIADVTRLPTNGCRPKSARRL